LIRRYVMSRRLYNLILKKRREPPKCKKCGEILHPGVPVVAKWGNSKVKHYHEDCARILRII